MKTYEIFCKNFSNFYTNTSIKTAVNDFEIDHPDEEIISIIEIDYNLVFNLNKVTGFLTNSLKEKS